MNSKVNKNIFLELNKRGVIYSVGRAYLFGQRVYFIVTSIRYRDRVDKLDFNERRGEPLLEREMTDEDFLRFSRLKDHFIIETQNEEGAIFEMEKKSLKKHIQKMETRAPEMVLAIERIVNAQKDKDLKQAISEAGNLIKWL